MIPRGHLNSDNDHLSESKIFRSFDLGQEKQGFPLKKIKVDLEMI